MSKTPVTSKPTSSLKPFPTRAILFYWAVQIGLGLLFSMLDLEDIEWIKEILTSLDNAFPTFRTGFVQSSTPVASKIFLAIWWLVIPPWGLIFFYNWTQGLKPHPNALNMNYMTLLGIFGAAAFMVFMLGSLLSFHDYSYYWMANKPNSPSRGDLVPALMSNGPFALSIWLAVSSWLIVSCIGLLLLLPRILWQKFFP